MNHNRATAAVLDEIGSAFHYRTVELEDLRDDEVLVDIAGVGICHTDISAAEGAVPLRFPTVLGHEGAGTVRAVGNAVTRLKTGDRVVLGFDSCRTCATCTGGRPAYCRRFAALNYGGGRRDGSTTLRDLRTGRDVHGNWFGQSSFATTAVASERNAVRIPDTLPLHLAGPLGCGISTGAGTVLRVLKPAAGEGIVVFGLGAVELGAVMAARVAGCTTVIEVDPDKRRHALARDLGATHVVNSHDLDDRGTLLRNLLGRRGPLPSTPWDTRA